jgi:hypothetical protein
MKEIVTGARDFWEAMLCDRLIAEGIEVSGWIIF